MGQHFHTRMMFVAAAAVSLFAAGEASAGVAIVSQSAKLDRANQSARFSITFDQTPDFTPGAAGIPANSFQYEIDANWFAGRSDPHPNDLSAIVRGDEIHDAGDALRVRSADSTKPDPDPVGGGWGPVLGTLPFELSGRTLTFDAPLALLGDDDGVFAYRVYAINGGASSAIIEGHVIPLPMGALTGGAGIAGLAVVEIVRRRRIVRVARLL